MFIDHKLLFKTPESWWGRRTPTTVSSPHRPGHHQPLRVIKHHGKWFLAWKQQYFYMIGTKQSWCGMRHSPCYQGSISATHHSHLPHCSSALFFSASHGLKLQAPQLCRRRLQSFMKIAASYEIFEHIFCKPLTALHCNLRTCVRPCHRNAMQYFVYE